MNSINVYIDGACSNNGKPNAMAGYGIYFGENDPRNESKRVCGKQSNNTGELTAFIRSLEILEPEIKNNITIHIYIDSEYVIKCASSYGAKLEKNNWKTSTGKTPPNLELLQKAHHLFKKSKCVKLHHIEAHTGKDDKHSLGNAEADRLACLSIGNTCEISRKQEDHIVLDWITFDTKDSAKALGAKWNVKKKHWYVEENVSIEVMDQLIALKSQKSAPPTKEDDVKKTYIKISFAKKDRAKSLGARWDSSVKSWYYVANSVPEDKQKELQKLANS